MANVGDVELLREIIKHGGRKYTAGNIDRTKYQRLVEREWLTVASANISDVLYDHCQGPTGRQLRSFPCA